MTFVTLFYQRLDILGERRPVVLLKYPGNGARESQVATRRLIVAQFFAYRVLRRQNYDSARAQGSNYGLKHIFKALHALNRSSVVEPSDKFLKE